MRIIPKNTKVKMQFYKSITFIDLIIGFIAFGLIALACLSNLSYKYFLAITILCIFLPAFIPIGDIKLYQFAGFYFKFLGNRKKYIKSLKSKSNVNSLCPYYKILNNIIQIKDGGFIGVLQITPIDFNLLSPEKQDFFIDNVFTSVLKTVGLFQEINILKIDKPLNFNNFIEDDINRLEKLKSSFENNDISEYEYNKRYEIIEDRAGLIETINNRNKIFASAYYISLFDLDKTNLESSLLNIESIFNSNGIKTNRLYDRELNIFVKYNYTKNVNENSISAKMKINDLLPNKILLKSNSIVQDDKLISQFVITDYPLKVDNAWASDIFNIENTKVVMKITSLEKAKAIRQIDNGINELLTQNQSAKASKQIDRQTHLETLQALLEGLQNDNESLFQVTLLISVYDDLKSTKNRKLVKNKLKSMGFKFSDLFGRQLEGYLTNTISNLNKVNYSRNINTSSLSACFPFVSDCLMDENGLLIGENQFPVMLDFFKRDDERVNSNIVVIGKSGSGKSFATKTILTQLSSLDSRIFILDPENEYTTLAKNMGGTILDVSSSKYGRFNPFQIMLGIDDINNDGSNNAFFSHLQFLEEFFRLILVGASFDSLELLNKLIVDCYKQKKINQNTDLSKLNVNDFPTFEDLAHLINKRLKAEKDDYLLNCLKVLNNYISKFQKGGRNANIWNGTTSFKPKENFVCFDFQKLLSNKNNVIANAQMLLILKWVENEVIKNRDYNLKNGTNRKIIVVVDEAHVFIDSKFPIALDFMFNLAKRIRKYDGMQIIITQNLADFVGDPEIAKKSTAIINVSQYSLIFSLAPNDINDLCLLYEKSGQINKNESDNIVSLPKGCAFLITSPTRRANVRIVATNFVKNNFEKLNN